MSGLERGVRAFKKKKQELEENSGGMRDVYNFNLKDGEEAIVWFLGLFRQPVSADVIKTWSIAEREYYAWLYGAYPLESGKKGERKTESVEQALLRRMREEEPFIFSSHRIPVKPFSITCSVETPIWEDRGDCVPCHAHSTNSKKYARASSKCGYSVLDTRRSHRVVLRDDSVSYQMCEAEWDLETGESDEDCKFCKKASDDENARIRPARIMGVRKWTPGPQWATLVMGVNERLNRLCRSCETGKIKVVGYLCGNMECQDTLRVDSKDSKVRCGECGQSNYPLEELRCSKCDEPVQSTLADAPVLVSRTGADKINTSYNLVERPLLAVPEDVRKWARAINWLAELKPPSTGKQAALLGLNADPFSGSSVGSEDYDEEDTPKPKRLGKPKPVSHDDDDFGDDDIPF